MDSYGKPRVGIWLKSALLISATMLLLLTISEIYFARTDQRTLLSEARDQAQAKAGSLASLVAMALAVDDLERIDDDLAAVMDNNSGDVGLLSLNVYDFNGSLLLHSHPLRTSSAWSHSLLDPDVAQEFTELALTSAQPRWAQVEGRDQRWLLLVSNPAVSGLREGTLVALFDLESVRSKVNYSKTRMMLLGIAFISLAIIVLFLGLERMVLRPIHHLTETIIALRKGDRSARAQDDTKDELGLLARAFNSMADELQTYTTTLEARVAARTEELSIRHQQLALANTELANAKARLEELARVDPLTRAFNRRYFQELMSLDSLWTEHSDRAWGLCMIDIDFFKLVNDNFGHPTGDLVLGKVASLISDTLRTTDILARIGGEEFVAVLFDTNRAAALQVAERLRRSVESHVFISEAGEPIPSVTISIGLVYYPEHSRARDQLLSLADRALYAAKRAGRNRVVVWSGELGPGAPAPQTGSSEHEP